MRLVIEDGKIEFGGKTLIEHINFDINNGQRTAWIDAGAACGQRRTRPCIPAGR